MNNHYTALLTGTIDSSVYNNVDNVITDVNERLKQYKNTIRKYINNSVFNKIIFAENSGYEFNAEEFEKLALECDKQFEYLKCPAYINETIEYGKSFGESRLITDAIKLSSILKNSDIVYKLTGRIYLKNSKQIVKTCHNHRNEFLVIENERWCYTNIFKVTVADYIKILEDDYKDIKKKGLDIEHTYYLRLKKANIDVGSFRTWPVFEGYMGGNNRPYSGSWKGDVYKTLLCKLRCYKMGSKLSKLAHF